MSDKFACAFCKVTDDGQEYSYFDETGKKDSFFLATNPLWGIKDRTYVLMTQLESDTRWMILGAGNQQPFCSFHPIQVLRWTDFIESEQGSIWKFVLNDDKNPSTVSFTCKDSRLILRGVNDIVIHDERFGLLFFGFSILPNTGFWPIRAVANINRFSCNSNEISMMSEVLFLSRLEGASSVDERILEYGSFSARLILPNTIADYSKPKEFIETIDSTKVSNFQQKLLEYENESYRFAKVFSTDSSSVRPYLIARAFYAYWRKTKMLKLTLPVSTFLATVKKYPFGVSSLTKADLQQYETVQVTDSSVSLPKDVKEYGDTNNWDTPISPEAFPVLWTFGTNLTPPIPPESPPVPEPTSVVQPAPSPVAKPVLAPAPECTPAQIYPPLPEADPFAEVNEIIAFKGVLDDAGWQYSSRDIVRFHTSVKTGALTILAGASGTGKSSLFKHYVRFVTGCDNEGDLWKRMNVVSTWMEPSDLLGWNNPLANAKETSFQPATGGLFEFLERVESKHTKPSFLCFEEMNLAQAELYFSDFLQAISELPDERRINNPKNGFFCIPNLRIVGTCNIDHTTKPFTERFLDRCNYIDLSEQNDRSSIESFFPNKLPDPKPKVPKHISLAVEQPVTITPNYLQSIRNALKKHQNDWCDFVTRINALGLYPSSRVRMSMAEYILNRPALDVKDDKPIVCKDEDKCILLGVDEAIAQRILPKLLLRGELERGDTFTGELSKLEDALGKLNFELSLSMLKRIRAAWPLA